MPERILHQTWTVRTLSPFARPLVLPAPAGAGAVPHDASIDASIGASNVAGSALGARRYPALMDLSDALTDRLRSLPELTGAGGGEAAGGTYTSVAWIVLPGVGGDGSVDSGDRREPGGTAGRKRHRGGARGLDPEQGRRQMQVHLHVDVRVRDEPAAQVLLCAARASADADAEASVAVASFRYVLLRGRSVAYLPVLTFLEGALGCSVGSRPFLLRPTDLASSLAGWMVAEAAAERERGGDEGRDRNLDRDRPASSRPLEITLAVPPHLSGGGKLGRIILTIPPVALSRLFHDVEGNRPDRRTSPSPGPRGGGTGGGIRAACQTVDRSRGSSSSSGSGSGNGTSNGRVTTSTAAESFFEEEDRDEGSPDADQDQNENQAHGPGRGRPGDGPQVRPVPILRALLCYLREAFGIDARHLAVVRAATGQAVLGTDGRVKPLAMESLPVLLEDLARMVGRGAASSDPAASGNGSSGWGDASTGAQDGPRSVRMAALHAVDTGGGRRLK